MLFLGKPASTCFKNRTVLMMTHDFSPVIDALKVFYTDLAPKPSVCFVRNDAGRISEHTVLPNDVLSVRNVMLTNMNLPNLSCILRAIYFRRLLEIDNEREGLPYQLISNLLHRRNNPLYLNSDGSERPLTNEEILVATTEIKDSIPDFDYTAWLDCANQCDNLKRLYVETTSGYEKLHLFRVMFPGYDGIDAVARKFVNESFHIENDYLYQLDPNKYDTVPRYVIEALDRVVEAG